MLHTPTYFNTETPNRNITFNIAAPTIYNRNENQNKIYILKNLCNFKK